MNRRRFADAMICAIALAAMMLGYIYVEIIAVKYAIIAVCATVLILFGILCVADRDAWYVSEKRHRSVIARGKRISGLALLNEYGKEIAVWDIAGKTSLIIGRDTGKESVDVNLLNTEYSGMVDRQHALMNYAAGVWYIEDIDSTNGVRIEKSDGKLYQISAGQPCRIEKGDIVVVGLTKLKLI